MIELSVAIPMFRAEYIGWLIMESLCRQTDVDFEWELVVAEELFEDAFGKERILGYRHRLEEAGCAKKRN